MFNSFLFFALLDAEKRDGSRQGTDGNRAHMLCMPDN